jgi:hypothetical protein
MLENFGHSGNFYAADSFGPSTQGEESLNFYPNILGTLEKILTLEKNGAVFGTFFCLLTYNTFCKLIFFSCPPFQVFSHMNVNMLGRTTLETLVNMRGYFNPLKSRGLTNLLIPASLDPKSKTMKNFFLELRYLNPFIPPLNVFCEGNFYICCVNGIALGLVLLLYPFHHLM